MSSQTLAESLRSGVKARLETLSNQFFPGFVLPGFMTGQRVTTMDAADLAYVLAWLKKLGTTEVGGLPIEEAVRRALRRVNGPQTQIFYSYRVAETILAFGPTFADNPLLEGLSEAELENLRVATDTTAIYNPVTREITNYPNNYWSVLARCEQRRRDLGLLADSTILDLSLQRMETLLFANPAGFFDDSVERGGKYDIYTADTHLFCEPLWPQLNQEKLQKNLQAHVRLLEISAQENGAAFSWGRSVGALSLCLTMELGSAALRLGLATEPQRMLALVEYAGQRFLKDWLDPEDGLVTSHRDRATEAYRGPYKHLQLTFDCMGKFLYTAKQLLDMPVPLEKTEPVQELFPATDVWFPLVAEDAKPAGLWAFRNGQMTFGLALTYGRNSDYTPSPRSPGLFENPTDSPLICALPRITWQDREYAAGGRPLSVEKIPAGLRVVHEGFPCFSEMSVAEIFPARREAVYRVEGDTLEVDEHWTFSTLPDALTWHLPESVHQPLRLEITSQPEGSHLSTTNVYGINAWRSAWGACARVHQVNFQPAPEVRFNYRIRPLLKVALSSADHDYMRLLYEAMPTDGCLVIRPTSGGMLPTNPAALTAVLAGCDVLHLHWPEWSFDLPASLDEAEKDRRLFLALETLGKLPTRIVWTMHNRRPHAVMSAERGRAFYRAMACIADAVIHHSQWGMDLMRAELPYKPNALHAIAAHGHFGSVNQTPETREEIEKRLGLPSCEVRFGVIGRPQKEKQADLIVRAFVASARPGQQLFVTAATPETIAAAGNDPRVIIQRRGDWLTREEIAAQLHVCDAIVNAVTGDSYLTSGTSADAIGLGQAMLVPEWEFFRETLGDAAFYHDNTEGGLAALFSRLGAEEIAQGKERMSALREKTDWKVSAATTLRLLRELPRKPVKV